MSGRKSCHDATVNDNFWGSPWSTKTRDSLIDLLGAGLAFCISDSIDYPINQGAGAKPFEFAAPQQGEQGVMKSTSNQKPKIHYFSSLNLRPHLLRPNQQQQLQKRCSNRDTMWRPNLQKHTKTCYPDGNATTKQLQTNSLNSAKMEAWPIQNQAFRLREVAFLQLCSICKKVC